MIADTYGAMRYAPRIVRDHGRWAPGGRSGEPGDVAVQGGVAYEGHRVDQRVGDDERGHPPPPAVQDAEHHAHRRVAEESAEPLVEVIRAAQDRAERDRSGRRPAELVEPPQQVPDDQDLFQDPVLEPV